MRQVLRREQASARRRVRTRSDPVRDDGLHVFVPALMGVGMIVSGILVLADWLQKLLPSGRLRRRQEVSNGAKGVVVSIAEAAGYEVEAPDFRRREWRPRWNYLASTLLFALAGSGALAAGLLAIALDLSDHVVGRAPEQPIRRDLLRRDRLPGVESREERLLFGAKWPTTLKSLVLGVATRITIGRP